MKTQNYLLKFLFSLAVLMLVTTISFGQDKPGPTSGGADLAAAIQNPVASMVSIPFQYNWDFYSGVNHGTLNVQPVLPFGLGKKWNVISRTIIPITTMPNPGTPDSRVGKLKGIGNITEAILFTPAKADKFIWAVGPTMTFPTVTENMGSLKFSIAPSVLAMYQTNGWTFGGLVQNFWSVAGNSNAPDYNLFYANVFIIKSFKSKWYLKTSPIITANWEAEKGKQWIVPLGLGIGKLSILNKLPINWSVMYQGFVEHSAGAHSTIQFQCTFILPSLYKK
jgi:hypothetical protein